MEILSQLKVDLLFIEICEMIQEEIIDGPDDLGIEGSESLDDVFVLREN